MLDEVIGFSFDGSLGSTDIRGEFTQTHADSGRNFFRGVLGAEHSFPNTLTLLAEYFYNGRATDHSLSEFLDSYNFASKFLTQKRNFLNLSASYELTPFLKWENYAIYDFDGESTFFNPELRYNLFSNFDISCGGQFYWGNADSEFGEYKNIYYAQAKYYF